MQIELAASRLAELGHSTRLSIFRLLVKAGQSGISVGDIQQQLDIPGSTLSHHLSRMIKVGLVEQQRDGRTLYCRLRFAEVEALLVFLYDECCVGDNQPGWLGIPASAGCSTDKC
jgi:ArsR family transcriptional regulator, arsenate/arsenite/antimonite-responsive transcriptional repressor